MKSLAIIQITGTVVDNNNAPLPGVTVASKDGKVTTVTDINGKFNINVDANQILVFKFIGYVSHEEPAKAGMTVKLQTQISNLDEVVIVGYGEQKKVDLTGSIATVSAKQLEDRPVINLGEGLKGLLPNVNVNLTGGQPGRGASFNIRGLGTIGQSSSSPLILVDGSQRDPNLIDPADVESVTVLKDAASAAIYGGRAAFGVILITTKKGKKGKVQLNYSGSFTTSRPVNLPKYINSVDFIRMFNVANRTGAATGGQTSSDPFTPTDSLMATAYYNDPAHNPYVYVDPGNPKKYRYVANTDWIHELYPGWAPQQQHNISLSGGEGKSTYYASMGYFSQSGLEKVANQTFKRYTPNIKINTDVTSWLSTQVSMSMTHTDNNSPSGSSIGQGGPTNGGWIPGDLRPLMPVYHPDGNYAGQGNYTNPVAIMKQSGRDIDSRNDFVSKAMVIIRPVKHLSVTADYMWNSFTSFERANRVPFNEYGVNGVFLNVFAWTNPSTINENRQNNVYNALNISSTYENTFNQKHYIKLLVGYNQEYQHYQLSNSTAKNLIDPTLVAIGVNNDPKPIVGGTETEAALVGTFFRFNYNYAGGRYLLEVNGRYDGTSRFRPSDRYAFSPSVSAGWNIIQEPFMESARKVVNELKLRASYGQLANQLAPGGASSTNQYPYIATQGYGTVGYLFNGQPGIVVNPPGLISSSLTWEKVQTKNIALDFSFLNQRLYGSFDYYVTDVKQQLVASQQLPAVLGASAPPSNAAATRTKGWELSLSWRDNALNQKLGYGFTFTLGDNSPTVVTSYNNNPSGSLSDYIPGQPLGNIYGFVTDGYYKTNAEAAAVNNKAIAGYTWLAGDIKYQDLNNDGKIDRGLNTLADHGDLKVIGNSVPRYKFGFSVNLNYKSFDFTAFMQGVLKQNYSAAGQGAFSAFNQGEFSLPYSNSLDFWTPQNPDAYFPRLRFSGTGNQQAQTKYLLNGAYGRLKQVTLGYTLPKLISDKLGVQKVRFFVTGTNLLTITSLFKAFDPEILSYTNYPLNKSVSVGLTATL